MAIFEIGPDRTDDLRTARPYFLVPLSGAASEDAPERECDRIARYLQDAQITDVYVLSHGWHRNFWSGVAAYDRLVSRFMVLLRRGRLAPLPLSFQPLFLAMHWNSDPDADAWVDTAGRRNKSDFLKRAAALFEPASAGLEGAMLNTFDDLYEYMTFLSEPDASPPIGAAQGKEAVLLRALSDHCEVRGRVDPHSVTPLEEKAALVWRCYSEADPMRVLLDQSEPPRPFASPWSAITNLIKFLVAALGLSVLLGLISKLISASHILPPVLGYLSSFGAWLRLQPQTGPMLAWLALRPRSVQILVLLLSLTSTALLILTGTVFWQQVIRRGSGARGLPVFAVGAWLPLQVLLAAPLLLYLFATFLFRTPVVILAPLVYALSPHWLGTRVWPLVLFLLACSLFSFLAGSLGLPVAGLFSERLPRRADGSFGPAPVRVRDALAWIAQQPIRWFRKSVAADSRSLVLADALEKQLAFWEMQRKGVQAGRQAGEFLDHLLTHLSEVGSPALKDARLHLVGHSFGGLVLANAARSLALAARPIHSLTLLQAALGSAWFVGEKWCRDSTIVKGTLACIYSAYDMANGFYYPAANNGRMAAGYVGLWKVGDTPEQPQVLGKNGLFASLGQPPVLAPLVKGTAPYALNLDASRLIFEGSPASGGGHDDIYKDDVIHMLWAITRL